MKRCERCGNEMVRPVTIGGPVWATRRYCSRACSRAPVVACVVEACDGRARGEHGLCNMHRQRVTKHGNPDRGRWPEAFARVMAKIRQGSCWEWTGSVSTGTGYGQVWFNGTNKVAHRVVYELLVGPIPAGLELDHLCRNRACVNPAHLEPVTTAENLRRMRVARAELRLEGSAAG